MNTNRAYRRELIETYNDEIVQCDEELAEGKISKAEYDQFVTNLKNNLNSELAELDNPTCEQ
jgi:hypothetical protein